MNTKNTYTLVTTCSDQIGIIAAVTGFLSKHGASITECQHFNDPESRRSFLRVSFSDSGQSLSSVSTLERQFSLEIAPRFDMHYYLHDTSRKMRTVVAVSKFGHCLCNLLHQWTSGSLPIEVVAVVSNHQDLRSKVEWYGVPFHYLPVTSGCKTEQEAQIIEVFEQTDAALLVLARYMQIFSSETTRYFNGRAINIHHSFLPSFKGAKPYHQAHVHGVKLVGATAHYVTAELDEGPIIEQSLERVDHTFTAEDLITIGSDIESIVLNRAVKWHAESRVFVNGQKTVVLR